jgi:hypothetical protein
VAVRAPAIGLIAVALASAGVAGCGSSDKKILDTERIERSIEASILKQRHIHTNVTCPSGVEQKKGLTFRCTATYSRGKTPFLVKQTDSKGSTHYSAVKK